MVKTKDTSLSKKITLFLKVIGLLILVTLGDLLITLIVTLQYKIFIPTIDINQIMKSLSYQVLLTIFITIYHIILIFYFYKKTSVTFQKLSLFTWLKCIIFGASIGLTYNFLINSSSSDSVHLMSILNVGIIGPILEEFLFRGWIYQKLQSIFSKSISRWITTLLFAFSHSGILNMIYAFLLGSVLIKSYDRTSNFKIPIIIHVGANLMVLLLYGLLKPYRMIGMIVGISIFISFYICNLKKVIPLK